MTARKKIRLSTKLASALCQMVRPDGNGGWERIIPHEQAKRMSEAEVLAAFHFDHDPIPKAHDGPDVHWNLTPRPVDEHREKTAKRDIPMIAKVKRLRGETRNGPRRKIASRKNAWPKGRKIQSRGFQKPAPQIST